MVQTNSSHTAPGLQEKRICNAGIFMYSIAKYIVHDDFTHVSKKGLSGAAKRQKQWMQCLFRLLNMSKSNNN